MAINYKNFLSNYAASIINVAIPILMLPWLVKIAGVERWGLVSLCVVIQTTLGIVEASLAQTGSRDVATYIKNNEVKKECENGFLTLLNMYITLGAFVGLVGLVLAPQVVESYFKIDNEFKNDATIVGCAAMIIVGFQLATSIYKSILVANANHFELSLTSVVATAIKNLGGYFSFEITNSFMIFMVVYVLATIVEAWLRVFFVNKIVTYKYKFFICFNSLTKRIREVGVLSAAIAASVFAGQLDKIIVGRMLTIEMLSLYTIAVTVAMGAMQFSQPILLTIAPDLYKSGNSMCVKSAVKKYGLVLIGIMMLCWLVYVPYGDEILLFWLRNEYIVNTIFPVTVILLIGVCVNVVYNLIYIGLVVANESRIIFLINFMQLITMLLICPFFVENFRIKGAAISWSLVQVASLLGALCYFTNKKNEKNYS